MSSDDRRQPGEGDREADRHYREQTRRFVKSGRVEKAAEQARGQDPEEAREAEQRGRQRAKEVDPEVHREYDKPASPGKPGGRDE